MKKHDIRKDDRLQISFVLDDCNKTTLETIASVRTASKDYVGCAFNTAEIFRPSLGFYLLS